jgi:probable O-glycosylation ligase (exosortase A-associated)
MMRPGLVRPGPAANLSAAHQGAIDMRVLFVLGIVAIGIRYSFQGAFYILLFYLWNAYFRPESWVWSDVISQMRLSLTIGTGLLVATLFSADRFRFGIGPLLLFAFLLQTVISTALSPSTADLWPFWIEFAKIIVVSYLIFVLVNTEERLRLTMIVIGLSLSFEGGKQGWAQLVRNPGVSNTNEWPMLGDNNGVAIGMLMLMAMLVALAQTAPRSLQKGLAWFLGVGVMFRAIFTYSRGGFLAATALALQYAARSKHKISSVLVIVALAWAISAVMPQHYWDRISTVRTAAGTTEASRIGYWWIGLDMAQDRPFIGVGTNAFMSMFDQYDPTFGATGSGRDVHSSWFGTLADLGYPGLILLVILLLRVALVARRARKAAKKRPDLHNIAVYATAFEAMVLVWCVGGTFITLQYKEFIWHVFALSMAADALVRERLAAPVPGTPPVAPEPVPLTNVAAVNIPLKLRRTSSDAPVTADEASVGGRR